MTENLVNVVIVTYNHEEFIERTIDSVLMQDCTFKVEVLVAEDCSTDSTRSLALKYARKYPDIVKVLEREKNMGPTRNSYDAYLQCKGKYIAVLDGDDYWTDEKKLQKQYDFLEQNKEYAGVTHLHETVDQYGKKVVTSHWQGHPGKYTIDDFRKGNVTIGHSSTLFFRNFFGEDKEKYDIIWQAHDFMGDVTLSLILLLRGSVYCMDDVMSVLRSRQAENGTNWGSISRKRDMEYETLEYSMKLLDWEKKYYKLADSSIKRMHKNVYLALVYFMGHRSGKGWSLLRKAIKQDAKKSGIIPFLFYMRKGKLENP